MEDDMNRVGFRLQVRPGRLEEYRAQHRAVWPEMREALRRCGWHRYSLFLDDDGALFGCFETPGTLDDAVAAMAGEPVNERWQTLMVPYFVSDTGPADRQMKQLDEVFHLP